MAFISVLLQIFWKTFYRNVSGVVLYQPYEFCHGNRKAKFSKKKKIKKNLLRSHKGDEAETLHKCLCY